MAQSAANGSFSTSSSSSIPPWKHHVFLSFRGQDTRRGFTDHLYAALQRQGMITFRDDEELERGGLISQVLPKAIEDSLSAIVILSQNYASSAWCLDELQKILESKKTLGRDVFPIFYGVDPSEVRYQKGIFGESFKKHEKRYTEDKVQRWRDALREIANLSGWDCNNRSEAKIIQDIIESVWAKLSTNLQSYNDDFVGIDSMIEKIHLLSNRASQDVRFIGIWGMGGTGKTTLARVIYERFRANFEIDCFLHNVTEVSKRSGLVHLQQTFLSHCKLEKSVINDTYDGKKIISSILRNRRVMLVLDDLSDRSHIDNLAGNRVWFGQGSTVIITTRDFHLLKAHGIHETYEIECLNTTESLKFFSQKAFGSDQPEEGYLELSKMAVQYTGGLPLALSVLGSFLSGINLSEWKEVLDEMKDAPRDDILNTLKISYDRLEDEEKNIFLDIACFFNGMKQDDVTKILKNCGLNATIGIKVLIAKSLVTSDGWTLEMHDLLQKMGRKIVYQESPNDSGRRSRLWSIEDISHVLGDKRGTRFIQGIVLESSPKSYEVNSKAKAFSNMCNLKLLMISNVQFLYGLTNLPNSLKVLAWNGYPLEALPLGQQDELVDLKMHHSKIIRPWNETQIFRKLKSIDLSQSNDLIQTPIVSGAPSLEKLILEGCTNLVEVHQSVGKHKKLVQLNMKNCINLKIFPSKLKMGSLKDFILSGCSKIELLPEFGENMKSLVMLDLKDCENLLRLPRSIRNLKSLETLHFSGCVYEDQLLEDLLMSEDQTLDNEKKNTSDDVMKPKDTSIQPRLQMSKDHILDNEKNISDDAMMSRDKPLQPQFQMFKDDIMDNEKEDISVDAMTLRDTSLQPQLQRSKDHIMDNETENIYSSPSVRATRRRIENSSTSWNSSSPNALRISNPIHPTTNHQDLQEFPMRSDDVIYPSSSMHSSSISETSKLSRFRDKICICERRASLKVSHDGKSYYVCDDNKCNYIELSCPEDSVFTDNCQSFEASHEHKISLLTNIILSLCSCISYFSSCFSGSRY